MEKRTKNPKYVKLYQSFWWWWFLKERKVHAPRNPPSLIHFFLLYFIPVSSILFQHCSFYLFCDTEDIFFFFFFVMKERGYLNYLIIISKKHHGVKGASRGDGSFGWEVVGGEKRVWKGGS